jgi:hypothetical protein
MEVLRPDVVTFICLSINNIRYDGYLCGKASDCLCTSWGQK